MKANPRIIVRYKSLWLIISLVLLLTFALSACGNNSTTTGSGHSNITEPAGSTSTPAPITSTQASTTGCPNNVVVTTSLPPANIVLKNISVDTTASARKGDIIEIDLPFGTNWQGPANVSQDLLTMHNPAGYASPTARVCVWRFTAANTGIAHLSFTGRPICKKGVFCPMYILDAPFTITIK